MSNIDLGFIEKTDTWKLKSKYFPSKVGGFPAWLCLKNLPSLQQLLCKKCEKPLAFLCQLYAPFLKNDHSFHRTVFVFICRVPDCSHENDARNIRVFRSQLPRVNDYYDSKPYKEEEEGCDVPSAADYNRICVICGAVGPKICGQCKNMHYCSRDHQAIDWKSGHKQNCKSEGTKQPTKNTFLFPEFMLEMEPEELDDESPEKTEEEVMREYKELLTSGRVVDANNEDQEDLADIAAKETDKQFQRFRTRISHDPNQVIRYERGGIPLWVSSTNKPSEVAPCPICGKDRKFEFQVMPQLLVHLKVDSIGKSIDWGTILVYTCPDSCRNHEEYVEEICFKQDYDPVDVLKQV